MVTINIILGDLAVFTLNLNGSTCPMQVRNVRGAKMISDNVWVFPAFLPFTQEILDDLDTIFGKENVELSDEVEDYLDELVLLPEEIKSRDFKGYTPLVEPYDHQAEGLAQLVRLPRWALFWDPGLGKTKAICDRILYERSHNPECLTLILALRVNLSTWVNEMAFHSGGSERIEALIATSPKQRVKRLEKIMETKPAGLVVTYETARVAEELLSGLKYRIIVADECHKMQSYKSGLTKAALRLSSKATFRYILSGTPSKGKPTDLWASLKFLGDHVVSSYWKFDERHVQRAHWNRHVIEGYKNLDKLQALLSSVSDSKRSNEVLDLPTRTFQEVYLTPEPSQRRAYNGILKSQLPYISIEGESIKIDPPVVKFAKLSQICTGFVYKSLKDETICDECPHLEACVEQEIKPYTRHCKVVTSDPGNKVIEIKSPVVDACLELVDSHMQAGKKIIVWAKHTQTIRSLYERLSCIYTGQVLRYDSTTDHPGEVEASFNTDPNKKIIVAQITMGIGVTFKAPIMIYTELSYSLSDWVQSLDRNWGIRAKGLGPILVQVLLIKNSIYDQAYKLLQAKQDVASLLRDTPDCAVCERFFNCVKDKIKPFDSACVLDKNTPTVKITTRQI